LWQCAQIDHSAKYNDIADASAVTTFSISRLNVLLQISHSTSYSYSRPVFLEPHTLRFRPRCHGTQRVHDFALSILPQPAGITSCLDAEGNAVDVAWFEGTHRQMAVSANLRVETLRINPFDFLVELGNTLLPPRHGRELSELLTPALARAPAGSGDLVAGLAEECRQDARGEIVSFLDLLNQRIHGGCRMAPRNDGEPLPPRETWARKEGACRDLAVLFMDACRAVGLPARFVSGYCRGGESRAHELHAWAEVHIPGAGWRGYDASMGLAAADAHVAVAASAFPSRAGPVTGTLRGTAITTLQTQVLVQGLEAATAM
jgi:transglutaminase-like putative cysteine protease